MFLILLHTVLVSFSDNCSSLKTGFSFLEGRHQAKSFTRVYYSERYLSFFQSFAEHNLISIQNPAYTVISIPCNLLQFLCSNLLCVWCCILLSASFILNTGNCCRGSCLLDLLLVFSTALFTCPHSSCIIVMKSKIHKHTDIHCGLFRVILGAVTHGPFLCHKDLSIMQHRDFQ